MLITSRSNETIKRAASLKIKKFRDEAGEYLVEGYKMVNDAIRFNADVRLILVTEEGVSRLGKTDAEIITVSESVLESVCDSVTPQGVAAVVKKSVFPEGEKPDVSVLLDGVRDPGNMGTIIRTCVAAGVKRVYLADCCDPYSPKAVRASMSGIYNAEIVETDIVSAIAALDGVPIIAADMNGTDVFGYEPPKRFCLAVGNEANGISEEVKKAAGAFVAIPMKKEIESLNAGVSLAVTLYELTVGKGRPLY
ncbi:MAG: RNA methyltransferase [Clostridia bacterium]|nr:RNA methyltransferase [Clostridia bacterium]